MKSLKGTLIYAIILIALFINPMKKGILAIMIILFALGHAAGYYTLSALTRKHE